MALVKVLKVGQSLFIGGTRLTVNSVDSDAIELTFAPAPAAVPATALHKRHTCIQLAPGVKIDIIDKGKQLDEVCLAITAPRHIKIG